MNDDAVLKAKNIALTTKSWRDAGKKIKNAFIELSTEQMLEVLDFWQKYMAKSLTDGELLSELNFWSEGGSFESHLNGYDALNPKVLVFEAKKRNWNVYCLLTIFCAIYIPISLFSFF